MQIIEKIWSQTKDEFENHLSHEEDVRHPITSIQIDGYHNIIIQKLNDLKSLKLIILKTK